MPAWRVRSRQAARERAPASARPRASPREPEPAREPGRATSAAGSAGAGTTAGGAVGAGGAMAGAGGGAGVGSAAAIGVGAGTGGAIGAGAGAWATASVAGTSATADSALATSTTGSAAGTRSRWPTVKWWRLRRLLRCARSPSVVSNFFAMIESVSPRRTRYEVVAGLGLDDATATLRTCAVSRTATSRTRALRPGSTSTWPRRRWCRLRRLLRRGELRLADSVAARDLRERVAASDLVVEVAVLLGEPRRFRHRREQLAHRPRDRARGQPHRERARNVLAAVPHRGAQRGVVLLEHAEVDAERARERGRGREPRQIDLGVGVGRLERDRAEIARRLAVDPRSGEERRVEVARGEAEARTAIAPHDLAHVGGAERASSALHSARAVVVGGDRERPGAGDLAVAREQPRGGLARDVGVETLVDDIVDAQEQPTGRLRELPHARRADPRVRLRVVGRLDVRKRDQLRGHAALRERLLDERAPLPGPHEAGAEPVGQTGLEAQVVGGAAQRRVGDVRGELREHARLFAREPLAFARREVEQDRADLALDLLGAQLARAVREVLWESHRLVHDAEVLGVVDQARAAVDLRVDARPELDGGLEARRASAGSSASAAGATRTRAQRRQRSSAAFAQGSAIGPRNLCCFGRARVASGRPRVHSQPPWSPGASPVAVLLPRFARLLALVALLRAAFRDRDAASLPRPRRAAAEAGRPRPRRRGGPCPGCREQAAARARAPTSCRASARSARPARARRGCAGRCRARSARARLLSIARAARARRASSSGSAPRRARSRDSSTCSASWPNIGSLATTSRSGPSFCTMRSCFSRSSSPNCPLQQALGVRSASRSSTTSSKSLTRPTMSPMPRIRHARPSGRNSSSRSSVSPVPRNLIGTPVTAFTASAAPPRASPSSLVSTRPSSESRSAKPFATCHRVAAHQRVAHEQRVGGPVAATISSSSASARRRSRAGPRCRRRSRRSPRARALRPRRADRGGRVARRAA